MAPHGVRGLRPDSKVQREVLRDHRHQARRNPADERALIGWGCHTHGKMLPCVATYSPSRRSCRWCCAWRRRCCGLRVIRIRITSSGITMPSQWVARIATRHLAALAAKSWLPTTESRDVTTGGIMCRHLVYIVRMEKGFNRRTRYRDTDGIALQDSPSRSKFSATLAGHAAPLAWACRHGSSCRLSCRRHFFPAFVGDSSADTMTENAGARPAATT